MKREQILEAVKCEGWQAFRVSLKGTPTRTKLERLRSYRNPETRILTHGAPTRRCECDQEKVDIQVLNYLQALARAGLIARLTDGLQQLKDGKVRILRKVVRSDAEDTK